MISLNNVSVVFGGEILFDNVAFMVNQGDRIGLVGKNGAGKSTMLKLMSGNLQPEDGDVSLPKDLKVGYLKQDIDFVDGLTVMQETETAFEELKAIEKQLLSLKKELEVREDYESDDYMGLITRMSDLEEKFVRMDGYSIQGEVSKVLTGLGFEESDFDKNTETFSGGWRMRIELAKILLQNPDVLLLDEPTNHLDIESIIWLEQWLKNYQGAVVLVSHDKTFLDTVTNRTIELEFGNANDYKAPYSKYVALREERQKNQEQAKKNQDKYIKHTQELINKFRYKKSKAAFAQALIKKLDKLKRIEVDSFDVSAISFRFPPAPHSGKVTLKAKGICKKYGELEVLNDVSLEVERGEKIAFAGKNGEGKTTLARIIAGDLKYEGQLELGHQVKIGYYAQNQSDLLDENRTVLETIERVAKGETLSRVRDILGTFLFSGDTVEKKIKVLSGGERARVALCKLLLEPVNLLVMDEPTNHLDMTTKDILKKALAKYNGTLIIVSHDRDFLQGLTEKVYEFKNKNIREHIGDITAFLQAKKVEDLRQLDLSKKNTAKKKDQKQASGNKHAYEKKKEEERELRKAKNRSGKLEQEIQSLESHLKELDAQLANPEKFKELSADSSFFEEYQAQKDQLNKLMNEWEGVQMRLEKIEGEDG